MRTPSTGLSERLAAAWIPVALAASVAMLAAAHAFERFGGYAPCLLCLKQREVDWVAAGMALVALAALRSPRLRALRPWMGLALGLVFLFGAGLAGFHAGVEWKWWPGPAACAAGGGSVAGLDMSGLVEGSLKVQLPSCDDAAWRLAGLSMAGWNALVSLGLAATGVAAWRFGRGRA